MERLVHLTRMSELGPFLERLFTTGEARLAARPESPDRRAVENVLRRAFAEYGLDVAGPPIDLDWDAALTAALFTARACWFAVSRDEPPEQLKTFLPTMPMPKTPAAHLSVDLTLRYLVTVYRRIHAENADDILVKRVGE